MNQTTVLLSPLRPLPHRSRTPSSLVSSSLCMMFSLVFRRSVSRTPAFFNTSVPLQFQQQLQTRTFLTASAPRHLAARTTTATKKSEDGSGAKAKTTSTKAKPATKAKAASKPKTKAQAKPKPKPKAAPKPKVKKIVKPPRLSPFILYLLLRRPLTRLSLLLLPTFGASDVVTPVNYLSSSLSGVKVTREELPPKRPGSSYILYSYDYRAAHPTDEKSVTAQQEFMKRIGTAWNELSDAEKAVRTSIPLPSQERGLNPCPVCMYSRTRSARVPNSRRTKSSTTNGQSTFVQRFLKK